jgi:hypothetical protein
MLKFSDGCRRSESIREVDAISSGDCRSALLKASLCQKFSGESI